MCCEHECLFACGCMSTVVCERVCVFARSPRPLGVMPLLSSGLVAQ